MFGFRSSTKEKRRPDVDRSIITGRFDRDRDATRALDAYSSVHPDGRDLRVAKVVKRDRGIRQHLGYAVVPRENVNRYGEVKS